MIQQSLLWVFLEEHENTNFKRCMHPYVHCSIFYSSQDTEQPKCSSTDEWVF